MSNIPLTKYVDIVSGVAGAAVLPRREMIGRIFTSNVLVPPQSPLEFSSLNAVASHFGTTSEEYERAAKYFGWVSPVISTASKISYGRYAPAATAPQVHSNTTAKSLAAINELDDDTLTLTMGGYTAAMTGVDLSGSASIAAAMATLEALIQAEVYGGDLFTGATVVYDPTTNRITLTGGETGEADISVSGTVADVLGWTSGATVCYGSDAQTPTESLIASDSQSDNFGSFLFIPALSNSQIADVAEWNDAQNVKYQYCVPTTKANQGALSALVDTYSGTGVTIVVADFDEMAQMIVLAATPFERRNGVMTPMFKQFDFAATVTDEAESDQLDAARVNYIGRTQSAGRTVSFYQPAVLKGLSTDPLDMNTYGNEQWLKADAANQIMNLLLSQGQVTANDQGAALVGNALQETIDASVFNGIIASGKNMTNQQKAFITQATGDEYAWQQVQSIGYWYSVTITTDQVGGVTRYKATYLLIYGKADAIRKVEGTHALI